MFTKNNWYHTNMYVEAFHTKVFVYERQINGHVDKCVHLVIKIAKDKAFQKQIKLEKGKTSY